MAAGRSHSEIQNPSPADQSSYKPSVVPRTPSTSSRPGFTPTSADDESLNDASLSVSSIMQSANDAGINNSAPPQTSSPRLTHDHLEAHNAAYCSDAAFCAQISKAIELQEAGVGLDINLPLHCFMPARSEFAQWIKQQAK
ncbi:hypothetical protein TW65_05201 [Stemphylium lycopersici]|uniref:Uncharacterized protein n=1 Tax=Stemphylium lycopersici TaxID=183478 RepID=A0A364N717_STELY|nr:hypothetical protein TW65_05201 [Stemphylium lycopersici]RAR13027.1 hypothetical protein DDE83_003552 [Stemphylium lycopersici]